MQNLDPEPSSSGLNLYEVLYILFKHKWKVILCAVIGLLAAAGYYFTDSPLYQSDAKILVRYVVDRSAVDPVEGANANASRMSESVINSEMEILTSWDLFEQVAEVVGVERLVPKSKGTATTTIAARNIGSGLTVSARGAGVIIVSYKNSDPELVVPVLDALLKGYFTKHLDIHRSKATFDLVSQQNELLRAALTKTEDDLKKKKVDAGGIISITDTAAAISAEISNTEHEINAAQTELARQRALVAALEKAYGASDPVKESLDKSTNPAAASSITKPGQAAASQTDAEKPHASTEDIEKYQAYVDEIGVLRRKGFLLRNTYNTDTQPIKSNLADIVAVENQRHEMERKYPELLERMATNVTTPGRQSDISMERAKLASLDAGVLTLETRLHNVQERAKEFARIAPEIEELERDKQLEQTNYTSSRSKLESATVDEALDPSKIPNISTVQRPSPAMKVMSTRQKLVMGLAGGGIGLGIFLSLFAELVLDQTIKRPAELENRLRIPLLLSIPYFASNGHALLPGKNGKSKTNGTAIEGQNHGRAVIAPWETTHFLHPYSVAIRDRLSLFFELNNLTHKPKLIAVTGFSKNCGASTIAAGIAAALSETGDGKVLLVDMNVGRGEIHPFFQGEPASCLTAALEREGEITSATENLYVAAGVDSKTDPVGFKRFHQLMPHFEASAFDYIIFDMPPVNQMSPTSGIARLMDKVLFVIESEKSNRDMVKRAYDDLVDGRSNVAVVFNKIRSHAPKWVEGEG